jgi:addiction module RelE/StbE family toxin
MSLLVVYSEIAKVDLLRIYNWFENEQPELGQKFIDSVEKAENSNIKSPLGFECRYKNTREIQISPFNYLLIYTVEKSVIYVHAIFPGKSNPKKKYKSLKK